MTKNIKSCIAIVLVLLLAAALAGCGKKDIPATPWEWAQSIEDGDIKSVSFWCSAEYYEQLAAEEGTDDTADEEEAPVYQETSAELSSKQISKLAKNLYRLEEANFSENTEGVTEAPLYGFVITMKDGTVYKINQSDSTLGKLEMNYGEKEWIISSDKLDSFVDTVIADCGYDKADAGVASSSDLIMEEVTGSDLEGEGDYSFSTYGNLG